MNSKQYYYIKILAREKSFSRAAEFLKISQPSLSQYIKKIEAELGVELFRRTGGELCLTPAGEICLQAGNKMLKLEEEMLDRIEDVKEDRAGVLCIGTAPFRASSLLPRAVYEFRKKYPGVTVRIKEDTFSALNASAERGEFDLCLSTIPEVPDLFHIEPVLEERLVLAVPVAFPVNAALAGYQDTAVPLAELAEVPFVTVGEDQVLGKRLSAIADAENVTIRKSAVCVDVLTCLAMARAGIGAALLPRHLASHHPELRLYAVEDPFRSREIVVFYRKDAYISHPMQEMIGQLKLLGKELFS